MRDDEHCGVNIIREEILTPASCRELLATHRVGRIALNVEGWPPVIRPVSYVFDADSHCIVFRSARGSKFTGLLISGQAAFEVDEVDDRLGVAWSVIALGQAEEVTRTNDIARLEQLDLADWTPDAKPHWFQLHPEHLSGRRLHTTP